MTLNLCHRCLISVKTIASTLGPVYSLGKHGRTLAKPWQSAQRWFLGMPRCVATKTQTETGRESQEASRTKKPAAYKKYPFMPTKQNRQIYVLDQVLADELAKIVRTNQSDPDVPVLEANPGPGVLTKTLLKAGVKRVFCAEALAKFLPYLEALQDKVGQEVLTLYNWDLFLLYMRLGEKECPYKEHEDNVASLVPHKDWADDTPLSVVCVIPETKEKLLLTYLLTTCTNQNGLFVLGRPEWFLVVSASLYKTLLDSGKEKDHSGVNYTYRAITLHQVFDIRFCGEVPGWRFTPSFPEKKKKLQRKQYADVSNSMRYVVRFRPHKEQVLAAVEIWAFYSFLRQVMKRKKERLIIAMEQLVPGCGIHLIMYGFSMMMVVVEVSPAQFVSIFKSLKTWPEFEGSPLKQYIAETSPVEDEKMDSAQKQS